MSYNSLMSYKIKKTQPCKVRRSTCKGVCNPIDFTQPWLPKPLLFDQSIGYRIYKSISFAIAESKDFIECDVPDSYFYHANYFFHHVKVWRDLYGSKFHYPNINTLILGICTRKDFSDYLKKVRKKSFIMSGFLRPLEKPEWWDKIEGHIIHDMDQIFPYTKGIPWKMDDPCDFKYMQIRCNPMSTTLSEFKGVLASILPTQIRMISDWYPSPSSSSTNDPNFKRFWEVYYSRRLKLVEYLTAKRACIQTGCNQTRDILIVDPDSMYTIMYIDRQTKEILKSFRNESLMNGLNREEMERKVRKFSKIKSHEIFYSRDFRKEGLTKPRQIMSAMGEVLEHMYGGIYRYMSIYNNITIADTETVRGHGLGMANCLTTLFQIALNKLIINRCGIDGFEVKNKIITYNDDFVAKFNTDHECESYIDMEDKIFDELSLMKVKSKSYVGKSISICEIYMPRTFNRKRLTNSSINILPLLCVNITHAKEVARSIPFKTLEERDYWIKKYTQKFGYEFYANEATRPYEFGGWFSDLVGTINNTFRYNFDSCSSKAFQAIREVNNYWKIKTKLKNPIDFTPIQFITDEYVSEIYKISLSELRSTYFRIPLNQYKKYYTTLREKRKRAYMNYQYLSIQELMGKYKLKDYYCPYGKKIFFTSESARRKNFYYDLIEEREILYSRYKQDCTMGTPLGMMLYKDMDFKKSNKATYYDIEFEGVISDLRDSKIEITEVENYFSFPPDAYTNAELNNENFVRVPTVKIDPGHRFILERDFAIFCTENNKIPCIDLYLDYMFPNLKEKKEDIVKNTENDKKLNVQTVKETKELDKKIQSEPDVFTEKDFFEWREFPNKKKTPARLAEDFSSISTWISLESSNIASSSTNKPLQIDERQLMILYLSGYDGVKFLDGKFQICEQESVDLSGGTFLDFYEY